MKRLSEHIFDFRGPRKAVFCLKITRSKSAGNHVVGQIHKLLHSLNGQITSLAKWKGKT